MKKLAWQHKLFHLFKKYSSQHRKSVNRATGNFLVPSFRTGWTLNKSSSNPTTGVKTRNLRTDTFQTHVGMLQLAKNSFKTERVRVYYLFSYCWNLWHLIWKPGSSRVEVKNWIIRVHISRHGCRLGSGNNFPFGRNVTAIKIRYLPQRICGDVIRETRRVSLTLVLVIERM